VRLLLLAGVAATLVAVCSAGGSGSKKFTDRPECAKLVGGLKPGDVVLTPKLDRMFRSALEALDVLAQLQKAGISLHMIDLGGDVTGNGISKLVFTILSAVAEAERDRIRERIRDVKTDQRNRRRYLGGKIPFGWSVDINGALVEVKEQQKAIGRMEELQKEGRSLRSIAAVLALEGYALSHAGVKKILVATRGSR
jgi:putative DNA-invertase from lambdoid prophage Rac